jgi:serine/threonine protein phosphatase PrpC
MMTRNPGSRHRYRPSVGRASRAGRGRRDNQDSLVAYASRDPALLARKGALFLVADGMRGCPAGAVASHLAARTVLRAYYTNPSNDPARSLQAAAGTADGWLRYWSVVRADLRGMGTTLTAAAVRNGELVVVHVGDSRAYLVRGRRAWLLTRDHTWAANACARGLLTRYEAHSHPWRHVLTRSLGGRSATVDVWRAPYASGDRLVLCSDGVGDLLAPPEVAWLAARAPGRAAKALVETARRRGGRDDASAIVVRLDGARRRGRSMNRARYVAPQPRRVPAAARHRSAQGVLFLALSLAAAAMRSA